MKYVLIDNGHGKNTAGKRSPDQSVLEYAYNRKMSAELYKRLSNIEGIKPIIIVPEEIDISLAERVKRINKYCNKYGAGNCIMISLHLNAAGHGDWMSARGWSVWTTRGQNNSDKLATICYNNMVKYQDILGKPRKNMSDGDPDWESNFYIIKGANCPSILTENLFMDNKEDVKILQSEEGFNAIVSLHVDTVKQWFKV